MTHLHSFVYSPRDHTISATFKNRIPGNLAKQRKQQIESKVAENNFYFRQNLSKQNKSLQVLIENVTTKEKLDSNYTKSYHLVQGFDEYYNLVQIQTQTPITRDCWLSIPYFTPKMDKNYAEI